MERRNSLCICLEPIEVVKAFKMHLTVYVIVNTILVVLNLALTPTKIWFIYPLIGWGIGVIAHYIFGVRANLAKTGEK